MKERILVIDDDQAFADSLRFALRKEFDVEVATNRREAREQLLFKVDAVLLDINFSGELSSGDTSGFAILEELREEFLLLPVVMLSGYEDPAIVIDAFRKGASDYIIKARMDIRELKVLLRRHLDKIRRVRASVGVAEEIKFIGNSGTTRLLKEEIARIAVFDTTVLLNGETGVGKEVAARYLHHLSHRARHPFVAVNLASLSPTVVEAELFGSVKGAFTGATTDRKGYFEVAHKGTLFLDEIGDLTHEVQVKLLRFLEDKSVCPVGSTKPVVVDTRLVCATHKNLQEEVKQGRFREDLYFRINVYNLVIPPLRQRKEDLEELISYFINRFAQQMGEPPRQMDEEAMALLNGYHWPGNIRELRNVVEAALIRAGMDRSQQVEARHLPVDIRDNGRPAVVRQTDDKGVDIDEEQNRLFVEYAEWALAQTMGNKTEAALRLGLKNDETLRYRIKTIYQKHPQLLEGKLWLGKLYGYLN